MRRRAAALVSSRAAAGPASVTPLDSAAFLGLGEADLTPQVQAALTTLLGEIDKLRREVGRLRALIYEAETLAD